MSNASRIAAALRRRFEGRGGPRAALRALGLDADLLAPADGGNTDAAKAMRVEIEQLLGELNLGEIETGKLLAVLDKHAPLDRLDDDDPHAERARELAGDNQLEVRAVLVAAGMSEADIIEAMRIVNGGPIGRLATDSADFAQRHPEIAELFS